MQAQSIDILEADILTFIMITCSYYLRGVLGFTKDINSGIFTQIKNNIEEFIGLEQFEATGGYNKRLYTWFSLRDLLIHKDKIYVSFTEEIKDNCFNTSVIYADMNYENIKFTKLSIH